MNEGIYYFPMELFSFPLNSNIQCRRVSGFSDFLLIHSLLESEFVEAGPGRKYLYFLLPCLRTVKFLKFFNFTNSFWKLKQKYSQRSQFFAPLLVDCGNHFEMAGLWMAGLGNVDAEISLIWRVSEQCSEQRMVGLLLGLCGKLFVD